MGFFAVCAAGTHGGLHIQAPRKGASCMLVFLADLVPPTGCLAFPVISGELQDDFECLGLHVHRH